MTQKLCHLKLRPTEWAHQAKNVCVCVCVYLGVGIFFHKEHHVWGTQDPGETTPAPHHTYLCVTETKSSWNNTWQCVGCFDIISVQYFIFWKCWWQLAAFVFQQFTKSSELWFEKPCSVLHVQLLPQLSCFLSIWSVCSHTSGMLVEFVIVIREFHSLLSSSERWRGKERVIIFLETKLNVCERRREDDALGNKASQIGLSFPIVHPRLSACPSAWHAHHRPWYNSLYMSSPFTCVLRAFPFLNLP